MKKSVEKDILESRYERFVYLPRLLQNWVAVDEEESKRIKSLIRATTKYLNYLENKLENINNEIGE